MESDLPGFKSLPFMGWQNELSNSQDLHFFHQYSFDNIYLTGSLSKDKIRICLAQCSFIMLSPSNSS